MIVLLPLACKAFASSLRDDFVPYDELDAGIGLKKGLSFSLIK